MADSFTTTQILAALIGLYFMAAGIGLLADREDFPAMVTELIAQPMLGYLGAILAFSIGGAIVAVHNNWNDFLSGFVSLIGWISLAEGVLMLACRKWFLGLFSRMALSPSVVTGFGGAALVAGIVLVSGVFTT